MLARAEVSPGVRCVYAALSILGAVFEAMPRGVGIFRVARRTKPSVRSSEVVMMVGCQEDAGQFGNRALEPCGRRASFAADVGKGKISNPTKYQTLSLTRSIQTGPCRGHTLHIHSVLSPLDRRVVK